MYVIIIVDDNQRSIFICCSMINHSISNKMISLNSLNEISAENNPIDTSRRRRTPSKYAESIRQLTKMTSKNSKREKNSEDNQDESPPMHSAKQEKGQALACILPSSGRKLKLSIIIKKSQKPKIKKIVSAVSIEKEKEKQKQKTKNVSLLQTLMQVVEQYKADEQNKREQNGLKGSEVGSGELEIGKKESRPRKQKEEEEKYCRLYDKYRSLNEKFQLMQNQLLLI